MKDINDFLEDAIDWILTNQQIPETLPGAALWRHMGSQEVLHSGGAHMTSHKHHGSLHVVLEEWYKNAQTLLPITLICLEQFDMGSQCYHLPL